MSSRIIVRNIPTNVDEIKLKSIFSKFGGVTDVKVCLKGEKHRRFCFIGYKNEQDAAKAKEYFNNTFIQMNKISVDYAKTADDPNLHSQKNRAQKRRGVILEEQEIGQKRLKKGEELIQDKKIITNTSELTPEQKFQEFKRLMQQGSKGTMSWNDVLTTIQQKPHKKDFKKMNQEGINQDGEEPQTFQKTALEDLDRQFEKLKNKKQNVIDDPTQDQIKVDSYLSKTTVTEQKNTKIDDCRLYVLNLPYDITEEDVREVFRKYGKITELKMPKGKGGQFRGFLYITYSLAGEAMRAFSELDNKIKFGRIIHIRPAFKEDSTEEKKQLDLEKKQQEIEKEKSSFKKQKKADMRKNLSDDTNWNTLFLNPNSILETIASRYNLKKSDILSPDAENMAVRIAHAETQIIAETKEWMLKQGLNLDFLNSNRQMCERSNTTILIKNISSKVENDGMKDLFNRYGHVSKFLLAPNKAIGIVQFDDPAHALNAFEKLSYFAIKNNPLYLEWAPLGLFEEEDIQIEKEKQGEIDDELSKILYIKNLNFDTKEATLEKLFEKAQVGNIRSVKIVKSGGKSQGYGFVEFNDHQSVMNSIKKLQNSLVDGHNLQLSISKQERKEVNKKERKQKLQDHQISTKMVIRNLAFECTKQDVKELLKAYGELKALRLPKKSNGHHRGFAFAEFSSAEEAKNAFLALENTHLYGRKLAIEWAKVE